MGLETGNFISDLNAANPTATDPVSKGDDHIRLVKKCVQQSFPNITGEVTATQDDLNKVAGGETVNVTGMITMFGGDTPPNGWLACDGAAIPVEYADLIAIVGANTPDLRGQFVRGWSANADVDPDGPRAPLDTQGHAMEDISGYFDLAPGTKASGAPGGSFSMGTSGYQYGSLGIGIQYDALRFQLTCPTPAEETRPVNTALMYIIKT